MKLAPPLVRPASLNPVSCDWRELALDDADQLAPSVEHGTAAVAGVHGVGELQQRHPRLAIAIARCCRRTSVICALVARGPDRHHPLALCAPAAGSRTERGQTDAGGLEQRDVEDRIEPRDPGLDLEAVRGAEPDVLGVEDDAGGGEDRALPRPRRRSPRECGRASAARAFLGLRTGRLRLGDHA